MENPYQFDTSGIHYNTLIQIQENVLLSEYNCNILYGNMFYKRKHEIINFKMSKIKLA